MHLLWLALSTIPTWQVAAWPSLLERSTNGVNYTAIFAPGLSPGASIHYPSQPDYKNETVQRYSDWEEPTFAVTIKPATDADVQKIVKRANANKLQFLATGGGHGSEPGFATVKNAVQIDLSNFKQNKLDLAGNTLTIGPGISFSGFETELAKAGKLIPVGNIYCVNMIGATIGATVGPYQGLVGLAIDYITSVRLITANGTLVTASKTQNSDLFWGIRGAGANFGIITSMTFRLDNAPNNGYLTSADFSFPGSANRSIFKILQDTQNNWPKEAGFNFYGSYNHTTNKTQANLAISYFGTPAQAQSYVNQFLALKPTRFENRSILWSELSAKQNFGASGTEGCETGIWNNHPTVGAKQVDAATYEKAFQNLENFSRGRPWYDGFFAVQRTNNQVTLAVPKADQGVYPGREISTYLILDNYYDGPVHDDDVFNNFSKPTRDLLVSTSGFSTINTYINYAYGDEGPEVWYGKQNLPRLVALKNKWDPNHVFGPGNPIPRTV